MDSAEKIEQIRDAQSRYSLFTAMHNMAQQAFMYEDEDKLSEQDRAILDSIRTGLNNARHTLNSFFVS